MVQPGPPTLSVPLPLPLKVLQARVSGPDRVIGHVNFFEKEVAGEMRIASR